MAEANVKLTRAIIWGKRDADRDDLGWCELDRQHCRWASWAHTCAALFAAKRHFTGQYQADRLDPRGEDSSKETSSNRSPTTLAEPWLQPAFTSSLLPINSQPSRGIVGLHVACGGPRPFTTRYRLTKSLFVVLAVQREAPNGVILGGASAGACLSAAAVLRMAGDGASTLAGAFLVTDSPRPVAGPVAGIAAPSPWSAPVCPCAEGSQLDESPLRGPTICPL